MRMKKGNSIWSCSFDGSYYDPGSSGYGKRGMTVKALFII